MMHFTNQLLNSMENTGNHQRLHMVLDEGRVRYRERINGRLSRVPFESNDYEDQFMVFTIIILNSSLTNIYFISRIFRFINIKLKTINYYYFNKMLFCTKRENVLKLDHTLVLL